MDCVKKGLAGRSWQGVITMCLLKTLEDIESLRKLQNLENITNCRNPQNWSTSDTNMILFAKLICAVFSYWVLAEIWISFFIVTWSKSWLEFFMVENSAKWRGFSSNIPTPPPASRHSLKSRPINEWTCYSGIKRQSHGGVAVRIWKPSRFVTQQFAAVQNCQLAPGKQQMKEGKAENCKLQIQDEIFIDLWEDTRQKKRSR